MKFRIIILLPLLIVLSCMGCSRDKRIDIKRFDRAVQSYCKVSNDCRDSLLSSYAPVISFMQIIEGVSDSDTLMLLLSQSRAVEVFQPDIEKYLSDLDPVEISLGELSENFASVLPEVVFPNSIYGAVIPYEQSVLLADSILILGLNHYLGADYPGYRTLDVYRRLLKNSNRIVYDVAESLIRCTYPYISDSYSTVFSRIVYEGLIVYALQLVVPGADLASVLGYSNEQLMWAAENESRVWHKLIQDNLLYSADVSVAFKLVEPSPFTSIINPSAPGRIGRYIGYKIVMGYFENNPDVSISGMISDGLYGSPEVLLGAQYKGE